MIRCCIVESGKVINAVEYESTPEGTPPGFPKGVVAIASEVGQIGWLYDGSNFNDPNPAAASPAITVLAGAAFLSRITDAEYVAITASTNVQVRRWIELLRMLGEIDLSGETTTAAKAGLLALGLLTKERAEMIFAPPA